MKNIIFKMIVVGCILVLGWWYTTYKMDGEVAKILVFIGWPVFFLYLFRETSKTI